MHENFGWQRQKLQVASRSHWSLDSTYIMHNVIIGKKKKKPNVRVRKAI